MTLPHLVFLIHHTSLAIYSERQESNLPLIEFIGGFLLYELS